MQDMVNRHQLESGFFGSIGIAGVEPLEGLQHPDVSEGPAEGGLSCNRGKQGVHGLIARGKRGSEKRWTIPGSSDEPLGQKPIGTFTLGYGERVGEEGFEGGLRYGLGALGLELRDGYVLDDIGDGFRLSNRGDREFPILYLTPLNDWDWEVTYAYCMRVIKVGACGSDGITHEGSIKLVHQHCGNIDCPLCYPSEAMRMANKASQKIWNGRIAFRQAGHLCGPIREFYVSPPQDWALPKLGSNSGYDELCREFSKVMKANGVMGGNWYFHPYRFNRLGKMAYRDYKRGLDVDEEALPKWQWVRTTDRWESYVHFSPHFHLFTWSKLTRSDKFFERTGWVYKSSGNPFNKVDNLKYKIAYCIDHAGLSETGNGNRHNVVHWLGQLTGYYITVRKVVENVAVMCPVCDGYVLEYDGWTADYGHGPPRIDMSGARCTGDDFTEARSYYFVDIRRGVD